MRKLFSRSIAVVLSLCLTVEITSGNAYAMAVPALCRAVPPEVLFDQTAMCQSLTEFGSGTFSRSGPLSLTRRLMLITSLTILSAAVAAAQKDPDKKKKDRREFQDTAALVQALIAQLDDPSAEKRQSAVAELVRLARARDPYTEYPEVWNALDTAFNQVRPGTPPHRKMGIIKVMTHLSSGRANTMINDYKSSDAELGEIFKAATLLMNLEKITNPTEDDIESADSKAQFMANLGRQYVVSRSYRNLRSAAPQDRDFYATIHFLSLAAMAQERFHLYGSKEFRQWIIQIVDRTEVDPEYDQSVAPAIKIGNAALVSSKNPEELMINTVSAVGRSWVQNRVSGLDKSSSLYAAIEALSSGVFTLAMLDDLKMLKAEAVNQVLGQTKANSERWSDIVARINLELPKVTAATTVKEFSNAVFGPPTAKLQNPKHTPLIVGILSVAYAFGMAFWEKRDNSAENPLEYVRRLMFNGTSDPGKFGNALQSLMQIQLPTPSLIGLLLEVVDYIHRPGLFMANDQVSLRAIVRLLIGQHGDGLNEVQESLSLYEKKSLPSRLRQPSPTEPEHFPTLRAASRYLRSDVPSDPAANVRPLSEEERYLINAEEISRVRRFAEDPQNGFMRKWDPLPFEKSKDETPVRYERRRNGDSLMFEIKKDGWSIELFEARQAKLSTMSWAAGKLLIADADKPAETINAPHGAMESYKIATGGNFPSSSINMHIQFLASLTFPSSVERGRAARDGLFTVTINNIRLQTNRDRGQGGRPPPGRRQVLVFIGSIFSHFLRALFHKPNHQPLEPRSA